MTSASPFEASILTPSVRDAAVHRLRPVQAMMDGFVLRNKNQHRHSAWWNEFCMLQRQLRKVLEHLERISDPAPPSLALQRLLRRRQRDGGPSQRQQRELAAYDRQQAHRNRFISQAQHRAAWLLQHAMEKAYNAFTQLATDKQFAQLGLILIGLLATIHHTLQTLVSPSTMKRLGNTEDGPWKRYPLWKQCLPRNPLSLEHERKQESISESSSTAHTLITPVPLASAHSVTRVESTSLAAGLVTPESMTDVGVTVARAAVARRKDTVVRREADAKHTADDVLESIEDESDDDRSVEGERIMEDDDQEGEEIQFFAGRNPSVDSSPSRTLARARSKEEQRRKETTRRDIDTGDTEDTRDTRGTSNTSSRTKVKETRISKEETPNTRKTQKEQKEAQLREVAQKPTKDQAKILVTPTVHRPNEPRFSRAGEEELLSRDPRGPNKKRKTSALDDIFGAADLAAERTDDARHKAKKKNKDGKSKGKSKGKKGGDLGDLFSSIL